MNKLGFRLISISTTLCLLALLMVIPLKAIGAEAAWSGDTAQTPPFITTTTPPVVSTTAVTGITNNSVTMVGNLDSMGTADTVKVFFEYGMTTSYGNTTTAQTMTVTGTFNATPTGLVPGTTYHFRAVADGGSNGIAYGPDMTFTTLRQARVSTNAATGIFYDSATLNGNLTSLGNATTVNVYFEYGKTVSYDNVTGTQPMTEPGTFGIKITRLSPGITYHFRAVADGGMHGKVTGADMTFTTTTIPPLVHTTTASSVTYATAIMKSELASLGTATTVNVYFEYGTTTSYGNTIGAQAMTATGTFSVSLTGLIPGTTYYFRAVADGGPNGKATDIDMAFTTMTANPPVVVTSRSTDVTNTTATLIGNLDHRGTAPTVNVYFEYGTTTSYGSSTTPMAMQSSSYSGGFSAVLTQRMPAELMPGTTYNLTKLMLGTTYHFRAVADGGVHGKPTGTDMTFTTTGTFIPLPPVVRTVEAASITVNSATINGSLTSLGNADVTKVYFEYGTTTNYGSATTPQAITATETFTANLTNLVPGTTYHFRAVADGGLHGLATGANMTFTTATTPPKVTTTTATNITNNAVTLSGNLVSPGTAAAVNVYFEYGTTTSYGKTTTMQPLTATGAFTTGLTDLTPGTTYHFRAVADGGTNGRAAGANMTFTTLQPASASPKPTGTVVATPTPTTTSIAPPTAIPPTTPITPVSTYREPNSLGIMVAVIIAVALVAGIMAWTIVSRRRK